MVDTGLTTGFKDKVAQNSIELNYDFNENLATEGVHFAVRGVWGMV